MNSFLKEEVRFFKGVSGAGFPFLGSVPVVDFPDMVALVIASDVFNNQANLCGCGRHYSGFALKFRALAQSSNCRLVYTWSRVLESSPLINQFLC